MPQPGGWQASLPPFYEPQGPDDETLTLTLILTLTLTLTLAPNPSP